MLRESVATMQRSVNCCKDAACSKEVGKEDAPKKNSKALPIPSRKVEEVNGVRTVEPNGINAVGDEEWTEIEVAVDSGATETVMGEDTLAGVIDITEGAACKRGVQYEVANGVQIPNLGERKFVGFTEEGIARSMTAQVCAVNKTLMSVSKIARGGNRVIFDEDGSYIEDKGTGEQIWMTQEGGMYYLKLWVSRKTSGF